MADISNKTAESLQTELAEKRESLRVYRFGGAGSRSRDVRGGRMIRKEIARILTELNSRNPSKHPKVAKKAKTA